MIRQVITDKTNPVLLTPTVHVTQFGEPASKLVQEMLAVLRQHKVGIALAANQIGDNRRVCVVQILWMPCIMAFFNPTITERVGKTTFEEGCLSLPGVLKWMHRAERITVEAQDVEGNPFTLHAGGILAIALQHEIDHLDGKLID